MYKDIVLHAHNACFGGLNHSIAKFEKSTVIVIVVVVAAAAAVNDNEVDHADNNRNIR
jgi:hypothetical protein